MNNTCPPRFTAAAGTKFAGASLSWLPSLSSPEKGFYSVRLHHPRDIAGSSNTHCPKSLTAACSVRAVFSPIVAGRPPRPTRDGRLGRLLTQPTT